MRAVEVLHDQPFMGRKLTVSGAKSKGQDEREDHEERDERPERQSRPVVVAPRPASAAPQSEVEPEIQTIVETVHEAPAEEIPVVAEAAPVATETPAESEAKSEIV